ncbi:DUF397 domain-containing protein [Nocardiopsis gilva YIM 90087]|uniref:DUF397 domain-containing protein n=1 Tax=Nocardiopsis gilva YIM 90087 TaxID=1235441 RepID=A0A223SD29_9ACTN|nr:DUF397 domain-containing protein [Nocardiopsis gilva]ASU86048.1 DUF397 domain-containing protein [Nocardiopsis gilva YIM 90087]
MQVPHLLWVKSSYSGTSSNCVEVTEFGHGVAVRDSKSPRGHLAFAIPEWSAFLQAVKDDELD